MDAPRESLSLQMAARPLHSGFAGLFKIDSSRYRAPFLASATDGVGPKQVVAQQVGVHDTIGLDVVAMVADDIVTCGAKPLFVLAYLQTGAMRAEDVEAIVAGVAKGCEIAGCQLADHQVGRQIGLVRDHEYGLSATGVGIVETEALLGRHRIRVGDVLIGMESSGLHANGFNVILSAVLGSGRGRLDAVIDDLDGPRSLGQALLTPTRIYAPDMLRLIAGCDVHALAHITGGGIAGSLSRVLPEFVDAIVDRSTWTPQPIFDYVAAKGRIYPDEMERNFNMGIGMIAAVPPQEADRAVALLAELGQTAWIAGEIVSGDGRVTVVSDYLAPS